MSNERIAHLEKIVAELQAENLRQQEMINTLMAVQMHSCIRQERTETWMEYVNFNFNL